MSIVGKYFKAFHSLHAITSYTSTCFDRSTNLVIYVGLLMCFRPVGSIIKLVLPGLSCLKPGKDTNKLLVPDLSISFWSF